MRGRTSLFKISHNRAAEVEPPAFIFPGYMAPVVRRAEDGDLELVKLSWGFVLLPDGSAPKRVTNVRDDQLLRSKFWRGSFEERRCLVLQRRSVSQTATQSQRVGIGSR